MSYRISDSVTNTFESDLKEFTEFLKELRSVQTNFESACSSILGKMRDLNFDSWKDSVSTEVQNYISGPMSDHMETINKDITSGGYTDLIAITEKIIDALNKCKAEKDAYDKAETDYNRAVSNLNGLSSNDPNYSSYLSDKNDADNRMTAAKSNIERYVSYCNELIGYYSRVKFGSTIASTLPDFNGYVNPSPYNNNPYYTTPSNSQSGGGNNPGPNTTPATSPNGCPCPGPTGSTADPYYGANTNNNGPNILQRFGSLLSGLGSGVKGLLGGALKIIGGFFSILGSLFSALFGSLDIGGWLKNTAIPWLVNAASDIKDWITNEAWPWLSGVFSSQTIKNFASGVKNFFSKYFGWVPNAISSLRSSFMSLPTETRVAAYATYGLLWAVNLISPFSFVPKLLLAASSAVLLPSLFQELGLTPATSTVGGGTSSGGNTGGNTGGNGANTGGNTSVGTNGGVTPPTSTPNYNVPQCTVKVTVNSGDPTAKSFLQSYPDIANYFKDPTSAIQTRTADPTSATYKQVQNNVNQLLSLSNGGQATLEYSVNSGLTLYIHTRVNGNKVEFFMGNTKIAECPENDVLNYAKKLSSVL